MELQLLGPIRVRNDAGERSITGRQKALLALLAIEAPGVVSTDRLVEAVWPGELPRHPANALQGRISQLRKIVDRAGSGLIAQGGTGYVLQVARDSVDVRRFEALAEEGHLALRAHDHATAAELTGQALGLWRGEALAGFAHEPWAIAEATRLEELRLGTLEDRFAALLGLGEHDRLVPELERLVHQCPLRERPRGQLMLALYRSGRQADALEVFHQGRRLLLEDLGIDPSQQLRDLERRILEQEPSLDWQPDAVSPPASLPGASARNRASTGPIVDDEPLPLAVGREVESAALDDAWRVTSTGRGRLVVLVGEPGIGKSHLAESFADHIRESDDSRVLIGRCAETEGAPPFWPWIQIVRTLVEELESDALAAALRTGAACVAQIVPDVRERLPEVVVPLSQDSTSARFAICDAVTTLLCRSAGVRPLLIVLEDLHRADAPSLDLLDLLTDRLATTPCLLVATTREDGTNERLASSLADLAGRSTATRLTLDGLSESALTVLVSERIDGAADDAMVQALQERTRGNPLFVTELLRLAESNGHDPERGVLSRIVEEVPRTLREVIGRRLGTLPDESREILQATAVVGRDAPVGWLAQVLALDPTTVLDRLEPAISAGILGETDGWPAGYRFEHVLVRDAVVAELPARRRAELHAAIADVLDRLPDDRKLSAVAHHRQQAAPLGQVGPAIDAAIAAADQAARLFAFEQAEGHLHDALQLVERYGDDAGHELSIHARLAFLLQETDGFMSPRVREAAEKVRALAGSITDAPEVVGVVYSLWAYWMNRARFDQAMAIAEELLATGTEAGDLAARAAGHFTRGQTRFFLGSLTEAEPDLLAAAELVGQLDPQESERRGISQVVLDARVGLGHPLWLLGRGEEAEVSIRAAIADADRTDNHYASAHGRLFMCWLTTVRQDAESTLAWSAQAVELCETHGFGLVANVVGPFEGWAMAAAGDPARGIERIGVTLEKLDAGGFQMLRPLHLGLLADALALARRDEEAHRAVTEAIGAAERTGERMHLAELQRQRARLLAADRSRLDDARAELAAARDLARTQGARALIERVDRDLGALATTS